MTPLVSRMVLLITGLIFALAITETALRWMDYGDYDAGQMGPGLLEYDRTLGWKLVPAVEVAHRHRDFDVTYRTDTWGLRHDGFTGSPGDASTWVLGDSFTFGLGVEDDETFVARINDRTGEGDVALVNFGQIGYATDQSALLLEKMIAWYGVPERVILVVYVGNDFVDNLHPVPTQAPRRKPFFEIEDGSLELRNVPVPQSRGDSPSFADEVLGRVYQSGTMERWLATTKLGSLIWSAKSKLMGVPQLAWDGQFDDQLTLFRGIIDRMRGQVPRLDLVLLGGKASVESPDSFSGQYQHYLLTQTLQMDLGEEVTVHDLITPLQAAYKNTGGVFYHPHEGHLTPAGHAWVAEYWPTLASEPSESNPSVE